MAEAAFLVIISGLNDVSFEIFDYGSIVAAAVNADLYENWTDVSGFLTTDPRIVKDPKPIEYISYIELRELSYMGASVLHEEAVFPVRIANIPIIGIGAGPADGQVLVAHDMFGMNKGFSPKFLRRYADLHTIMTDALGDYINDVKASNFPNESEQY